MRITCDNTSKMLRIVPGTCKHTEMLNEGHDYEEEEEEESLAIISWAPATCLALCRTLASQRQIKRTGFTFHKASFVSFFDSVSVFLSFIILHKIANSSETCLFLSISAILTLNLKITRIPQESLLFPFVYLWIRFKNYVSSPQL